jgi:LmbE family N-acetylglucosaminyl deacetylase
MSFRSRLRPVKRASASAVELIWRVGFGAAAWLVRRDINRWISPGGQRVLVVAPHPDDEAIGCVGTILLHVQSGDRVCVAIATDGRRSRAIPDPVQMALQRRREATDAARLMQLERLEWLGLPEGEWSVRALQDPLRALIEEIEPHIIYAPSRIDFHPEHFKVAHALALALGDVGVRQERVRVYQVQVPLTPVIANLVADVSALVPRCEAVLRAYVSQAGSVQCAYRQRRYSALLHGIAKHAEEFWEMPASRYVALHSVPPLQWPNAFRGLRNFPITDPLAYLVGRNARRKMRCG